MSYTGKKPCAGCGRPGNVKSRYKVDGLCYDCQQHLRRGKAIEISENIEWVSLKAVKHLTAWFIAVLMLAMIVSYSIGIRDAKITQSDALETLINGSKEFGNYFQGHYKDAVVIVATGGNYEAGVKLLRQAEKEFINTH